jgi:hypothetical protein
MTEATNRREKMVPHSETIIDNPAAILWYHPRERIVHHEFRRFIYGEEFRDVLEKGLEVFRTRGANKWLSDDRANGPIRPADGQWALEDWAPRVLAAGWRYWAVVLPTRTLGEMNMKRWVDTYAKQGVVARAFTDPDEAMSWLKSV